MSVKALHFTSYVLCGVLACLQGGCHYTPSEQPYLHEVRFRSVWDYAIGRLSYDEVVKAWGPPTSIISGVALESTPLDTVPIRATWHWTHSVPRAGISSQGDSLMFGQRVELVFSRGPELLMDWRYWEWGRQDISYRH